MPLSYRQACPAPVQEKSGKSGTMRYFSAMRTVGLLVLPGTRVFDTAVAAEVWGREHRDTGLGRFDLRVCTPGKKNHPMHPIGTLVATHGLNGLEDCDLVVATGRQDHLADVPN